MAGNAQKIPFAQSINQFTQKKIEDALQLTGKALPASVISNDNSIVTVKFELNAQYTLPNVTIPLFGSEYVRLPIQPGCLGFVVPADARLSGVSGIGGGTADLNQPANLTALVFFPIANTSWSEVDPQAVTLYGPNGVVLRDTASNSTIVLTPSAIAIVGQDSVSISSGGATMSLNSSGAWSISGAAAGSLSAVGGLAMSDGTHSTNLSTMNSVFEALITYINGHTHTNSAGMTGGPDVPYSGGNIVS